MVRRAGRLTVTPAWVTVETSVISLATVLPSGLIRRLTLTVVEVVTTGRSALGAASFAIRSLTGPAGRSSTRAGRLGCQPAAGCSAWLVLSWPVLAVSSRRLPGLVFS